MKKAIFSLFLFGAIVGATPVDVTLLDVGNRAIDSTGQYYVGPYTLTLNGVATPAMCMNDLIDTNIGDQWSANVTAANSSDFSDTYLGNGGASVYGMSFTSSQLYNAEAYLFNLITQPGADQAGIQEAAWFIMDPTNPTYSSNASVQSYLQAAYVNSPSFDSSGFSIVSDVQKGGEQEFMVADAPEPASLALFGFGLIGVAGGRFFRRKQVKA